MIRTTLALVLAAASLPAADPEMLKLVPADAKAVAGIHVDRSLSSPFGQLMLSQIQEDDKHFREFIDAAGFDPRRDLREILLVTVDQKRKNALVIARGVFNGPQILAAAQKQSNGTLTNYSGVPVLRFGGKTTGMLAFLEGSLALAGQEALVQAALDRRNAPAGGSALAQKAATVDSRYDAWFVATGVFNPPAAVQPRNAPTAPTAALAAIQESSGGVQFGTLVRVDAEAVTRSEKDAQALVDVVKFLTGMIQLNREKMPDIDRFQPVLNSLQVNAVANTVKLSFAVPQTDLEQLIKSRRASKRASR